MIVVIPSRYSSTRLPGKALLDIAGKTLIEHVYRCAVASSAKRVIIATDDERIKQTAVNFGAEVCLTGDHHRSGTERIAEVIDALAIDEDEIVVNLQGDEPLMPAALINQVADLLQNDTAADMATAYHSIDSETDYRNPDIVKLVVDKNGYACYFSRAPIPWQPSVYNPAGPAPAYWHIGIYAYRAAFIKTYTAWKACPWEQAESLEQLRVLYHGGNIAACQAIEVPGPGVDNQEDLERVRQYF